jgi:hypothetical protein
MSILSIVLLEFVFLVLSAGDYTQLGKMCEIFFCIAINLHPEKLVFQYQWKCFKGSQNVQNICLWGLK